MSAFHPLQTSQPIIYGRAMRRMTIMLACGLASGVVLLCMMVFNLTGDCPGNRCEPTVESVSYLVIGTGIALIACLVVRSVQKRTF
jgi:hypothetical protein